MVIINSYLLYRISEMRTGIMVWKKTCEMKQKKGPSSVQRRSEMGAGKIVWKKICEMNRKNVKWIKKRAHLLYRRSEIGAGKIVWKKICEMNQKNVLTSRPWDRWLFNYIILFKIPVVRPVQEEHYFRLYKINNSYALRSVKKSIIYQAL